MGKMTREVKEQRHTTKTKAVKNFMGGTSYELNPFETMKMVTASSIFGEPAYYRDGKYAEKTIVKDATFKVDKAFINYELLSLDKFEGKATSEIMEIVIDDALRYDYKSTLEWAITLRKEFLMRLNPQIIMVRAAIMTDERKKFTSAYPSLFANINEQVMQRGDDVIAQVTYYLYLNGSKNNIPVILKRSWARRIERASRYEVYKYRNHGIGLTDVVRICHAKGDTVSELMTTGTIAMDESNVTWETLRSNGDSWETILNKIKLPHMAALRNIRGIFTEISDIDTVNSFMNDIINGVEKGKQFPFRYMSASRAVAHCDDVNHKQIILDKLEDCLDKACENLPRLKGNNAFLSDNSGSAWGTFNSEYGTVTVAEIGNLSAVIGAANSDEGTVFVFGDKLIPQTISKRQGILHQAKNLKGKSVGGSTENGVWLFFDEAITKGIIYDNIFIYSDMQAGHGGLYGIDAKQYEAFRIGGRYIDVARLVAVYRQKVNSKVNVYCIQTAGYDNVMVPENGYRTNILYGWTGKELVYADAINKFWDEYDANHNK